MDINAMNVLTQSLADICRSELIAEKWLLSPSLRVENQWLETVARREQACLNVHLKTLLSLAVDLATPQMTERGANLAPDHACVLLIERVLREVRTQLRYLRDLEPSTHLAEAVWHSINSLRLSGVGPSGLTRRLVRSSAQGPGPRPDSARIRAVACHVACRPAPHDLSRLLKAHAFDLQIHLKQLARLERCGV